MGSAVGVSITSVLLVQGTQIMHSRLAETVTPFNRMLQTHAAYLFWNSASTKGLAAINIEVTRQASIVAYANDFKFLLLISLPTVLLLPLLRRPRQHIGKVELSAPE